MHNAFSAILGLMAPLCFAATISNATAAPPAKAAEDHYIAARDGFGPAKLHIDTFNRGDEGFGMLDGLRSSSR